MVRRKPRPYRAAERRQIVATAEGRGRVSFEKSATEWRKSPKESFAPTVLMTHLYRKPRPSAVATICRRSAARIGGASRDILHLTWTVLPHRGGCPRSGQGGRSQAKCFPSCQPLDRLQVLCGRYLCPGGTAMRPFVLAAA